MTTTINKANLLTCPICGNKVELTKDGGEYAINCECGLYFEVENNTDLNKLVYKWNNQMGYEQGRVDAIDEFIKYYKDNYESMKQIENGREPFVFIVSLIRRAEQLKEETENV